MSNQIGGQQDTYQLKREKQDFIARKLIKIDKDKEYGFPLKDLNNKIRKKHYGSLVQKLKQHKANLDDAEQCSHDSLQFESDKCNFCKAHTMQDYKIPMSKLENLIAHDFEKLKVKAELAKL